MVRDRVRDTNAEVWLRRLYARPGWGSLVGMESRRRCFAGSLGRMLIVRDGRCRVPWCDAPIRHLDHPVPASERGPTAERNGQGLCEACNYAKQAPGWSARLTSDGAVQTVTPTGHLYLSRPPPGMGRPPPGTSTTGNASRVEASFQRVLLAG